jgi:hypothetical protein
MNKRYILSSLLLFIGGHLAGQETTTPVLNKTNRIILHYKDTSGLFTKLARILIDRGHDIDFENRELGILRTKPSTIPGAYTLYEQMEVKTVFRDSTITLSSVAHTVDYYGTITNEDVYFTNRKWDLINLSWDELMRITGLLKPDSVTYLTVSVLAPRQKLGHPKPSK